MTPENTQRLHLYSLRSIAIASLLGGPAAAGYILCRNFKTLGQIAQGEKALIIGVCGTLLLFLLIFLVPETYLDRIPNIWIPLLYTVIIYTLASKLQGVALQQHKENNHPFYSAWKATGIAGIFALVVTLFIFGVAFFSTETEVYETYDTEMAVFYKNETESLQFYEHLNTETSTALLYELDTEILPKWEKNISILKSWQQHPELPKDIKTENQLLLAYAKNRVKAFALFKKAIAEDSDLYDEALEETHNLLEKQIRELEALRTF